jgi:hypothetical protein
LKSKLHKLRKVSFDELRVRGSQAIAAFAERNNWSRRSKLPDDDTLLRLFNQASVQALRDHFRNRTAPVFFAAFDDPQATIGELRGRWPNAETDIVERANRITEGRFDLLGFRNLSFGMPIDWHLEPIVNKRAPLVHWSRLNYMNADLFGDQKIVWELNRHQYFVTLGQAYWLTRDERYAATFVAHVNSWMVQNPPKLGVNWASSLEVAFRTISWLWALHFFKDSAAFTPETCLRFFKFLYLNARHLETYLSTYFSPNTHLTGEALGLVYLGTLLPEFKESLRWRDKGLQILLEQLQRHVQPDGVYFEQSSHYHRYTTDFYLHLRLLLSANHKAVPPELDEKLRLLLDHLMYITRPDGTTPLFGDDDGGRLIPLSQRAGNDFRATLSTGAALFDCAGYKFVADEPAEDTLWLLGPGGLATLDRVIAAEPERQSVAFPHSGYYVMRDGWTPKSNYLFFDCGPHGTDNCGHAHADALSFELVAKGRSVFVDPGTYTYTGSRELRDWFRSSFAHNTLTIDNEPSSDSDSPFSWKTIADSECSSWITQEQFDYVVAAHDGFNRLAEPARHTRSILFFKNNYWVLRDQVESVGAHVLKEWFHLNFRLTPSQSKGNTVRINGEAGAAVLHMAGFFQNGRWAEEQGWVSECYGEKHAAPVLVFNVAINGSAELVTFLMPEDTGARRRVREIEALNGRAFEINAEGRHDVLLLSNSGKARIETSRFASDFSVTWARFDGPELQTPEELILINGRTLQFEGRDLLRSTNKLSYVTVMPDLQGDKCELDESVSISVDPRLKSKSLCAVLTNSIEKPPAIYL